MANGGFEPDRTTLKKVSLVDVSRGVSKGAEECPVKHQLRFYPKIIGAARSKSWVTLTLASAQARQVRKMGVDATAATAVRLRVIQLRLPTGPIEPLVTT